MTETEMVELGDYCEFTLAHPQFNTLVQTFEQDIGKQILATNPTKPEDRESLYAAFNGVKHFLGLMQTLALETRNLRKDYETKTEQKSTQEPQELPDDVVFDLYRKDDVEAFEDNS